MEPVPKNDPTSNFISKLSLISEILEKVFISSWIMLLELKELQYKGLNHIQLGYTKFSCTPLLCGVPLMFPFCLETLTSTTLTFFNIL